MRIIHMVKYTPEALVAIRAAGYAERERYANEAMEGLGGKIIAINWTLHEEWDAVNVAELPDNKTVFDMQAAIRASGAVERSHVTIAFTSDEADAALGNMEYAGPGQ